MNKEGQRVVAILIPNYAIMDKFLKLLERCELEIGKQPTKLGWLDIVHMYFESEHDVIV